MFLFDEANEFLLSRGYRTSLRYVLRKILNCFRDKWIGIVEFATTYRKVRR